MTPRLFVRKPAEADLATAFDWYESHRTGLGAEFAEQISTVYAAIEEEPHRFPIVLDDIRMALVHRFPYVIYFVVLPRHTSVLAVVHGHCKPILMVHEMANLPGKVWSRHPSYKN